MDLKNRSFPNYDLDCCYLNCELHWSWNCCLRGWDWSSYYGLGCYLNCYCLNCG